MSPSDLPFWGWLLLGGALLVFMVLISALNEWLTIIEIPGCSTVVFEWLPPIHPTLYGRVRSIIKWLALVMLFLAAVTFVIGIIRFVRWAWVG
jgi:phosphoglycerol transferase MdoB-like AlkP superfamily enzyme